jgi:AraC-like DNA-binding protein
MPSLKIFKSIILLTKSVCLLLYIITNNQEQNQNTTKEKNNQKKDSSTKQIKAQLQLEKAKYTKDWVAATKAYREIMYVSPKKEWLAYTDSIITLAKRTNNDIIIGEAYLSKGIIYYDQKEHKKALDNYILADEYISKTNDKYAIHKTKYVLAQTKYYLGFYDEAISLFKDGLTYFEEENELAYLNSLHALGLCYNKIKKYDLCTYYNNLGVSKGIEYNNQEMAVYFEHSEGINNYFLNKNAEAIQLLKKTIPILQSNKDYANETVAYFYLGKIHLQTHQENRAISYFEKVNKAFITYNYIRPDLREAFEILIKQAKKQNNDNLHLQYINQLFKVDSVINTNYKYLSKKIHKEYDTKKLLSEKEEIEQSLLNKNKNSWFIIIGLSSVVAILGYAHYHNKKRNKQKLEAILNNKIAKTKQKKFEIDIESDINPEIIKNILLNLEKLEKTNKFLEKELTLHKLALLLKTNTKYASKIILKYRGKKSIEYISDIKTNHIIELLKNENKYRNYTNKALADEAGFGSTQNFTKAFKNKTGVSPTVFIQEIIKQRNTTVNTEL